MSMLMVTDENGYRFIELWEGLKLKAYDDGTGTLTIGYGHTSDAGPPRVYRGMRITKDEAVAILKADIASVDANINHHVTFPIHQDQHNAIAAFDFNTGKLHSSTLLKDLNAGKLGRIERDFLMYTKMTVRGRKVTAKGLVKRRKAEYLLFSTGKIVGP